MEKLRGNYTLRVLFSDPQYNEARSARVQGVIGQDGAIGAFVADSYGYREFSGGVCRASA